MSDGSSFEFFQVSPQTFQPYTGPIGVHERAGIHELYLIGDHVVLAATTGSGGEDEN